jgi:hypothetical protein
LGIEPILVDVQALRRFGSEFEAMGLAIASDAKGVTGFETGQHADEAVGDGLFRKDSPSEFLLTHAGRGKIDDGPIQANGIRQARLFHFVAEVQGPLGIILQPYAQVA